MPVRAKLASGSPEGFCLEAGQAFHGDSGRRPCCRQCRGKNSQKGLRPVFPLAGAGPGTVGGRFEGRVRKASDLVELLAVEQEGAPLDAGTVLVVPALTRP